MSDPTLILRDIHQQLTLHIAQRAQAQGDGITVKAVDRRDNAADDALRQQPCLQLAAEQRFQFALDNLVAACADCGGQVGALA